MGDAVDERDAGAAEGAGLMDALIRKLVSSAPRGIITFLIVAAAIEAAWQRSGGVAHLHKRRGQIERAYTHVTDIVPTMLDLAGVPVEMGTFDGRAVAGRTAEFLSHAPAV